MLLTKHKWSVPEITQMIDYVVALMVMLMILFKKKKKNGNVYHVVDDDQSGRAPTVDNIILHLMVNVFFFVY